MRQSANISTKNLRRIKDSFKEEIENTVSHITELASTLKSPSKDRITQSSYSLSIN